MDLLPNPERRWQQDHDRLPVSRNEIESLIGPVTTRWRLLGGGLANTNVDLGDGTVLRIYRGALDGKANEARCLRQPWASLRVPRILDEGESFLRLERVPHTPLLPLLEHGRATGRALAEIHRASHGPAGLLDAEGRVARPFPDFVQAMIDYVRSPEALDDRRAELAGEVYRWIESHAEILGKLGSESVRLHGDFKVSNLHWAGDLPLVLDWEFTYSGPRWMDIGQLFRWGAPEPFRSAFAAGYTESGNRLPRDWSSWAAGFDLVNLLGLLGKSPAGSRREADLRARIREVVARSPEDPSW